MTLAAFSLQNVGPVSTASLWLGFDLAASLAWALSGALLAARRGYDVTGIFAIALVSSTGGGLLRDAVFLQEGAPAVVRSSTYILLAFAATVIVWVFGKRLLELRWFARAVVVLDSLGLGAFAVVGMLLATKAALSLPGVVLIGVVNAVGGSLFRSILLREVPELFRPGELIATAALIGCVAYLVLTRVVEIEREPASVVTVLLVAAVRLASIRYRLHTTPARGFEIEPSDSKPADRL